MIFARVLLTILIFVGLTFATSLLVERFYFSRLRWVLVLFLLAATSAIYVYRDKLEVVMDALTGGRDGYNIFLVVLAGILSGIFISASCVIFRGIITAFRWAISLFIAKDK